MREWTIAVLAMIAAGCGSATHGAPDGSVAGVLGNPDAGAHVAATFPAPHPPPPQVISLGGPVLASPKIVSIFFANEDPTTEASLQDFAARIGNSSYWSAATHEYGVGPATAAPPVALQETATGQWTSDQITQWLTDKLNSNDPAVPQPDGNTIYVLHFPPGVTIVAPGVTGTVASCKDIGGYHADLTLDGAHNSKKVAFVVMPQCPQFNGANGLDAITGPESHELVEAATDPYPMLSPAFATVDQDHFYWAIELGAGEVGDLCAQDPQASATFPGLPYVVQRIWSNASASSGDDPCVPLLPGEAYFNAAPELTDPVNVTYAGQTITTKGVHIPVGQAVTIAIDLFSDADTHGPWNVQAEDLSAILGGPTQLQLSLDRTTGQNGDQLHLTIKPTQAGIMGYEPFVIISSLGGQAHFWIGAVGS